MREELDMQAPLFCINPPCIAEEEIEIYSTDKSFAMKERDNVLHYLLLSLFMTPDWLVDWLTGPRSVSTRFVALAD